MSIPHYELFIDGEWVDSPEHYEIRSPATDELVATVAKGDVSHIDRAVAAAKAAHESGVWRNKPPEERADLLHAVAARIAARTQELAGLRTRGNRAPRGQHRGAQARRARPAARPRGGQGVRGGRPAQGRAQRRRRRRRPGRRL